MNRLDELISFNNSFIHRKEYEKYTATKFPDKRMVIFSCMDTRLIELLPKALGLKNGDAKIIKNAGAIITHPFGSIMRSIIIAIYELKAEEVFVIGHHGCGMSNIDPSSVIDHMREQGISDETMNTLDYAGINIETWLHGFDCVHDSVKKSVNIIRNHPLVPKSLAVHGLIIDPDTGKLEIVINGYQN